MKKKFKLSKDSSRVIPAAVIDDFELPDDFKHNRMSDSDVAVLKSMVIKFQRSGAIDEEVNGYTTEDENTSERIIGESFENSVNESNLTPDNYDEEAFEELKRYSASKEAGDNPYADLDLFDIKN